VPLVRSDRIHAVRLLTGVQQPNNTGQQIPSPIGTAPLESQMGAQPDDRTGITCERSAGALATVTRQCPPDLSQRRVTQAKGEKLKRSEMQNAVRRKTQ
jgi:hypothetical protein